MLAVYLEKRCAGQYQDEFVLILNVIGGYLQFAAHDLFNDHVSDARQVLNTLARGGRR